MTQTPEVRGSEVLRHETDYEVVAPDPAGTIESLSALGYSLEAAVADLVDNSIDAGARKIDVLFHWAGAESYVAVVDDGRGMSEYELRTAMAIALKGPRVERAAAELGRFGMGLKAASFSQASRLTVWSKAAGSRPATRIWDLRRVVQSGEWQLLRQVDITTDALLRSLSATIGDSGTIVLWNGLTKIVADLATSDDESAHKQFLEAVARVDRHLGMTFARFLPGHAVRRRQPVVLTVNGARVEPWDPFLRDHESTVREPVEQLEVNGALVLIRPYVLPPKRRLTDEQHRRGGGPRGWLEQQGFYVFRNDRLIVSGGWLGLPGFRSDEKHILARIAVEIPSAIDEQWSVDVRKSTAHPPLLLRAPLTRTGKATRIRAQQILSSVSRTKAVEKSDELSFVWRPERTGDELRLRLNWAHPLVREALQTSGDARPVVRALLKFVEETVPVAAMRMLFDGESDRDYVPFSRTPDEVLKVAEQMYRAYVSQGLSPSQATTRLKHTPPFNEYPDLPYLLNLT